MRILQITDLHFKESGAKDDQIHISQAIINGLARETPPDLVFFTGDLVFSGNNVDVFENAWSNIGEPLMKLWGLGSDRFFICPGNHDMNRNQELEMIVKGVAGIETVEALDQFATLPAKKTEFELSLKNNENYFQFLSKFGSQHYAPKDIITPLYTAHKRIIGQRNVGVVTLNSAWRCKSSKTDRNNLLFPPALIHDAFEHVKDCDVRLLLMHHPISDFKEFVIRELERIIYRDFHVLFTGHVHGKRLDTSLQSEEGIGIVVGPAALVHYETWSNLGCGFYDIDCDLWTLNASVCDYDRNSSSLFPSKQYGTIRIPFAEEKTQKIKLLEKIRDVYEIEVERADELLLPDPTMNTKRKFLEIFSDPVIMDVPESAVTKEKPIIKLDKIRVDRLNTLIYGDDKSGKTVILQKLFLDYLNSFVRFKILPVYIDIKSLANKNKEISIEQLIARKYSINRNKVRDLCNSYTICILADNCDASFSKLKKLLTEFQDITKKYFFIGTSSELVSNLLSLESLNVEQPVQLYLHELGNSQVRTIASKIVEFGEEQIDQLLVKSRSVFNQLNIPVNYWNCSLFFSVNDSASNITLRSQFDLIQLYVEKILDRSQFASDSNPGISFETFKSYLGALAHFLRSKNIALPSATWEDIRKFTAEHRQNNLKFSIDTESFMQLLLKLNIFRALDGEYLTFRINGIYEYSFAVYLHLNESFRNELFNTSFLNYPNQWDYYSGLAKNDVGFLQNTMQRAGQIFEPLIKQYINEIPEDSLLLKIPSTFREELSLALHDDVATDKVIPLRPEEKDEIDDEMRSEVSPAMRKQMQAASTQALDDETDMNATERAFRIVCRVFRNTDFNDSDEVLRMFDHILTWGMLFGAAIEDEIKDAPVGSIPLPGNDEQQEFTKQLVRQYMPLVVEGLIFQHIAQANMKRIFEMAREKYGKDQTKKQYKHFLVTLLIIELNPSEGMKLIQDLVKETSNSTLGHILYYKLFTLLVTKGHDNKSFVSKLKQAIMELAGKLWPNGREIALQQLKAQERMAQIKPD